MGATVITKHFNKHIWTLWKGKKPNPPELVPKFVIEPQPDKQAGLLFLGMNPSLPKQINTDFDNWLRNQGQFPEGYNDGYRARSFWQNSGLSNRFVPEIAHRFANVHHNARQFYKFFARVNCMAKAMVPSIWDYAMVDLCFSLSSSSTKIKKLRSDDPEFGKKQAEIAFDLICAWKPRMIVSLYVSTGDEFLRMWLKKFHVVGKEVMLHKNLLKTVLVGPWGTDAIFLKPKARSLVNSPGCLSQGDFEEVAQTISDCWSTQGANSGAVAGG